MTPTQYVRAFARSWWLIVLCTAGGLGVSALVSAAIAPVYLSTASVLVTSTATINPGALQGTVLAQQRVISYAEIPRGQALAETVVSELDLSLTPGELRNQIDVRVPAQSSVVRITVHDTASGRAQLIASEVSRRSAAAINTLEKSRSQGAPLLRARVVGGVGSPATAVAPPAWRNPAIGLAAGLAVGLALAVIRARFDRRIRDASAAHEVLGAPLLGVLPTHRWWLPRAGQADDGEHWASSIRQLRTSIYFLRPDPADCLTLAITSPGPMDRMSQIVGDVAVALADAGASVLLVQSDLHGSTRPPVPGAESDEQPGLADYLAGTDSGEALVQHHALPGVDVVPPGSAHPHPEDLLHSEALDVLLDEAAEKYDFILVATAATTLGTDAAAVAARCDGAVLVLSRRSTRRREVRSALAQLEGVEAPVLGGVLVP